MTEEFIKSDAFLETYEWRKLRQEVIIASDQRCSCCGIKPDNTNNIYLCVDHIKPRKTHPELALDKSNLQVLCNECNHGKGNWDNHNWNKNKDFIISKDWLLKFTNNFSGVKKAQLSALNLSWPPSKGWTEILIGTCISLEQKRLFEINLNNKAKYSGKQKQIKRKVNIITD